MDHKIAAYTGTRNLYPMMVPAVKSLLYNSDVDEVWLFIEDDVFPLAVPEMVKVRNVSGQTYFPPDGPNMRSRYTYMAMMRAVYADLFPDADRVLSLDVDTICKADISDLWDLPIDDCYFAASVEPERTKDEGYFYSNIGVCLYNLAKLRDGKWREVVAALNAKKYRNLEQDVFNLLCQGAIYDMPSEYNKSDYTKRCDAGKIIHYAGKRFWHNRPQYMRFEQMGWPEVLEHRRQTCGK